VGGPANCYCNEDLLLFRLSTNPVGERAATLQLSSSFRSHHHFMDLMTHSLLGHLISGLFRPKLWATRCCLSTIPARSIAHFASCVRHRLCQGPVVPVCGSPLGTQLTCILLCPHGICDYLYFILQKKWALHAMDSCRWEWAPAMSKLIQRGQFVCIAMHGS
jgi:hypothetical protein